MTENNNLIENEEQGIVLPEKTEDAEDRQTEPVEKKEKGDKKDPQSVSVVGVRFRSCGKGACQKGGGLFNRQCGWSST